VFLRPSGGHGMAATEGYMVSVLKQAPGVSDFEYG